MNLTVIAGLAGATVALVILIAAIANIRTNGVLATLEENLVNMYTPDIIDADIEEIVKADDCE